MLKELTTIVITILLASEVRAHDTVATHKHDMPPVQSLPHRPESKGPARPPPLLTGSMPFSGQGFWKFVAVNDAVPVPADARAKVKDAHGTVIVDAEQDVVYWGLKHVGWVGFSNQLRNSWIVKGDDAFTHFNLHGADIWPQKGKRPLIAAADNEGYKIYLTDTTFQHPQLMLAPPTGPYATNQTFRPTDVAFVGPDRIFVTDGYARHYFMPASIEPLAYEGTFYGGNAFSETPHGITYDLRDKSLLVSARPEGQLKRWSAKKEELLEVGALPEGTLLCDVDLWGDYALAACLEAPDKKPGPLMVLNLKKKTIASIIKPKEELGYDFADHMHDACWHIRKTGRITEVYIVFTAWNPGGIGALKLVNVPD